MAVSVGTMQLTLSIPIMQGPTSVTIIQVLRFYCNYIGGTFCYTYVCRSFCCSDEGDCFCCNYAVRSFCNTYAGERFCSKYVGDNFYGNYAEGGISVAIMQVLFSTVHYAHDYFYYNYAGGCFRCSYVCDNFKQQLYILFSNRHLFFIKLTRKHLRALYQVCI